MTFFVVADGSSQYGRAWAAAMRIVRFPFQAEVAKTPASSAKALNSSALPAGSEVIDRNSEMKPRGLSHV
jgi:hypothetical protein